MKYIVYQTTNKINGKIYIGVHKTKNPEIFDGYIGNGINIGWSLDNPKTLYQRALKKYGYNAFIRTVLFVYDTAQEAYQKEVELVTFDFIQQDSNYNIRVGGLQGGTNFVQIYQFNYQGILIKKWNSIQEAVEYYSCNPSRFHMAAVNKYSAFESYWSYDDYIDISDYRKSQQCETYQYDMKGNLIKIHKNTAEAAKALDFNRQRINETISKKIPYKEFFFVKDPDFIMDVIKNYKFNKVNSRVIVQYDLEGNKIDEFISITKAAQSLGINYSTLKKNIGNKHIFLDKYYFEYYIPVNLKKTKVAQYDFNTKELIKIWDCVSDCAKIYPKCRDVLKGGRNHTHGYTFEYIYD